MTDHTAATATTPEMETPEMTEAQHAETYAAMTAAHATIRCAYCDRMATVARNADGDSPTECQPCQEIRSRDCWQCGATFRPAWDDDSHNSVRYCPECVAIRARQESEAAEYRAALADMLADMTAIHRGLAYALTSHGWTDHISPFLPRVTECVTDALSAVGMGDPNYLPHFDSGRPVLAALAALRLWDASALAYFGHMAIADGFDADALPRFENSASNIGRTPDMVRSAIREFWTEMQSITRDMADENDYCGEYESSLERIHSILRTPGMADVEYRNREYIVTVPVTITAYARITVTASDDDNARELAEMEGVDYNDLDIDRWNVDIEPDWYSAESEAQ